MPRIKLSLLLFAGILCSVARAGNYPAPIQALIGKGVTIKGSMHAPNGYHGYVGEYGGDPIPVYLLPDGKHVIVGTLYDAKGNDLTEEVFAAATKPAMDSSLWSRLEHSTWIAEGTAKPARIVYVFTDTECPFCHKLWLESQPYLQRDKVQVRNIIVAVIAPESLGRGVAVLAAANPTATWRRYERAFGHSLIKPPMRMNAVRRAEIDTNTALLKSIGSFGTPTIIYRDESGRVRMILGIPDQKTLLAIFSG